MISNLTGIMAAAGIILMGAGAVSFAAWLLVNFLPGGLFILGLIFLAISNIIEQW